MRVVASSKGGIQEKENRKGIGREKGNERNLGMDENRMEILKSNYTGKRI